jgi:putative transposase
MNKKPIFSHLYRYIEQNHLRAGKVNEPEGYGCSSFQVHGLGKNFELCSPHPLYLALGKNPAERQLNYRPLFASQVVGNLIEDIRMANHSIMVLGNDKFKDESVILTGKRLHNLPSGRKPEWRSNTFNRVLTPILHLIAF